MLAYAKDLSDVEAGKRMYEFIEQVFTDKQELIMTYGQILKQEGIQEGLIRGVKEGMQQGMEARNLEIAKNMLVQGLDINLIQKVTGLSLDIIKDLVC